MTRHGWLLVIALAACGGGSKAKTGTTTPPVTGSPAKTQTWDYAGDDASAAAAPAAADAAFSKESVRATMQSMKGQFRACYEQGLLKSPGLAGTLTFKFSIKTDGTVASVQVNGLGNADVEKCAASEIAKATFAKPTAVTAITYPVTFAATP